MKYRKKPVVVDAKKFPGITLDTLNEILDFEGWVKPLAKKNKCWPLKYRGSRLIISTLEGEMAADPGDWIVCGPFGELYPVKPGIFSATYEQV